MEGQVGKWLKELEVLRKVGRERPHEGFALLVRGVVAKWRYLMRTAGGEAESFAGLDDGMRAVVREVVGWAMDDGEWDWMRLPGGRGGMGIPDIELEVGRS